jgi:hypothetical protein
MEPHPQASPRGPHGEPEESLDQIGSFIEFRRSTLIVTCRSADFGIDLCHSNRALSDFDTFTAAHQVYMRFDLTAIVTGHRALADLHSLIVFANYIFYK